MGARDWGGFIRSTLPITQWLPQYERTWLRPDLVAGLTLAAYAIPVSVAYASLAGLPPQAGLYCYLVGGVVYAVFGTSRQLAIGPTSAISILIGSALGLLSNGDTQHQVHLAMAVAVLAGFVGIIGWALRLGNITNFVSETILSGFKVGAGLVIASTQLPKLFGVHGGGSANAERVGRSGETSWSGACPGGSPRAGERSSAGGRTGIADSGGRAADEDRCIDRNEKACSAGRRLRKKCSRGKENTPVIKGLNRLYTVAASQPGNSDRARSVLLQGNSDFAKASGAWANGKRTDGLHPARGVSLGGRNTTAPAQTPFAAILGCADARVPPEIVFNIGSNEIFVVRVAGNVLGQDCLGSLRYAASQFSTTLKLLGIAQEQVHSCGLMV